MRKLSLVIFALGLIFVSAGCTQVQDALRTGIPSSGTTASSGQGLLTVSFPAIGQGDAAIVQGPNGTTMLIDSGSAADGPALIAYLRGLGISTLDIVVATHPQDDSVGGLASVLDAFPVGTLVDNGVASDSAAYNELLSLAAEKNVTVRTVSHGDELYLDPKVNISVLNPQKILLTDLSENSQLNQNSIVLRLEYGDRSFLFMSDAETETENVLRTNGDVLKSDVLKVAYHGSSASSGTKFLNSVNPEVAVIGTETSRKYPSATVLKRLDTLGSAVYRTDLNGTITVTTDGSSLDVVTTGKQAE